MQCVYWEFPETGGQQAVRMGNWKAIRKDIKKGNMQLELYNLEQDVQEHNNIAAKHPDIVKQMEQIMKQEHEPAEIEKFKMKELGD